MKTCVWGSFLCVQEEFPEEYGPKFDEELEKLLWEFLIRLDQLLPVPNLAQVHLHSPVCLSLCMIP
jgi:hypothetical protein